MASVATIQEDQLAEIFKGYDKIVSVYLYYLGEKKGSELVESNP
jgi:hypothetical protein